MSDTKKRGWTAPTVEDEATHKAGGGATDEGTRFVKRRDGVSSVRKTDGKGADVETKMVHRVPGEAKTRGGRSNGRRKRSETTLSPERCKALVEQARKTLRSMAKAHREGRLTDGERARVERLIREVEKAVGREIERRT